MPSGKNWMFFLYINLAFIVYALIVFYYSQLQEIQDNWALYRCNPLYMPLADDIETNFQYCIQNSMSSFMGFIMQPLSFITSNLTASVSSITDEINMVRAMFDKIRNFITNIIQTIFGVFLNIIIEFQKIIISVKDLIGKSIGIMLTLMYTIQGSVMTMQSTWNGPPGQLVRALGSCFHPDTKVKLANGDKVCMKDLNLGDILVNGSTVEAVMKINNKSEPVSLYKIPGTGVDGEDIYVTGSHLIYNNSDCYARFLEVKHYLKAEETDIKCDWFSCLITSDHKICIGSEIFWDWEDHFIKYDSYII